jgi:uroporphyrinogen decarboxylase
MEKTTRNCITWLECQLERMVDPFAVLVLDDLVGLMGPEDAQTFGFPFLRRIFEAFPDHLHIFHNDTPNSKVFEGLSHVGIDIFNFSHLTPLEEARRLMGPEVVLMGNINPQEILVHASPEEVKAAVKAQLQGAEELGPILVSPGGGVAPHTPINNLKALVQTVNSWEERC